MGRLFGVVKYDITCRECPWSELHQYFQEVSCFSALGSIVKGWGQACGWQLLDMDRDILAATRTGPISVLPVA